MGKRTMWTKQHKIVWELLRQDGRYTAKKEYILKDLGDEAYLVLEAYDWLVDHMPGSGNRPADAEYPVWLSYSGETVRMTDPETVILKLSVDEALITPVNVIKWGKIMDYSYIPANEADAERHRTLLADYRVSDVKAYMSQFYPQIKREIIASWDRLFDDTILLGNDLKYGLIWELREEWVLDVME